MAGSDDSSSLKIGAAVLGGGGVVGAASIFGFKKEVILIILAGIVVLFVLLIIFRLALKWLAARKANPFSQTIAGAAGTTPQMITEAAARAQLDDLRRNFESGIAKLRAAGKDLYTLPWYLLIGEAGSGKTEAIRRSSLPFPPGLQDMFQGTGGTVNMNWWFSNEAVILDTAGRYLFDEVQAGASGEWVEFLQLLVRQRYDCPINGLILVIPADSLIRDTSDEIEKKASIIAQQLNRIQVTLNVRFPVYILITKCDKINGFRPFFDALRDPQAQHQILGWSNPTPLDVPFNCELVDQHLRDVRKSLLERRLGLLLDPVPIESADGRRIDEVDDLFALPDSLLQIGPRLRRYLETVFVQSGWAQPLFLRGIYFTSSMTKDGALDAQLAALLHVPVDSLPEGRSWEQDRSFFLRDIFLKKVFPERGLVTRSTDTKRSERRRKLVLLGAGFAAAITLCGFTWFAAQDLNRGIRGQNDYWQAVSEMMARPDLNISLIAPSSDPDAMFRSRFEEPLIIGDDPSTVGEFYKVAWDHVQEPISVPWALKPASWLVDRTHTLADRRGEDWGMLYLSQVLRPLLDAANTKLAAQKPGEWPADASQALTQSLRFETTAADSALAPFRISDTAAVSGTVSSFLSNSPTVGNALAAVGALSPPTKSATSQELDLRPIVQYVLPADYDKLRKEKALVPLQASLTWLRQQKSLWPTHSDISTVPPDGGISRFVDYWTAQINGSNPRLKALIKTRNSILSLRKSFDELKQVCQAIQSKPPLSTKDYEDFRAVWQAAWSRHTSAERAMEAQLAAVGWDGTTPLADTYASELARVQSEGSTAFAALMAELPRLKPEAEQDSRCEEIFHQRKSLEDGAASLASGVVVDVPLQNQLKEMDNGILASYASADGTPVPIYKGVTDVYAKLNARLSQTSSSQTTPSGGATWIDSPPIDDTQTLQTAHNQIDDAERLMPAQAICNELRANSAILMGRMADPVRRYQSAMSLLLGTPATAEEVRDLVAQRQQEAYTLPSVPMTSNAASAVPTEPGYNPATASDVLQAAKKQIEHVNLGSSTDVVLDTDALNDHRAKLQSAIEAYTHLYLGYWSKIEFPKLDLTHAGISTWVDAQGKAGLPARASQIDKPLGDFADRIQQAADKVIQLNIIAQPDQAPEVQQIRAQVDGARAALRHNAPPEAEFDTALENWRALSSDSALARAKLLQLKPSKFLAYLVLPPQSAAPGEVDFVTAYWNDLSVGLLHLLGDSAEAQGNVMRHSLAQFKKFPFDRYDPAIGAMGFDELNQLRAALASIPTPVAGKGAGEDVDIGSGGRFNNLDTINAELDRIASGALTTPQLALLASVKQFVDALPPNENQPYQCKISVPFSPLDRAQWGGFCQQWLRAKFPSAGVLDASLQWSDVQLDQGGGISSRITIQQEKTRNDPADLTARELGEVLFPGNRISFSFFVIPAATNADVVIPDGVNEMPMKTWQLLQMLTTHNGRRVSEDGKRWCIELQISREHQVYSTWFQLEFDHGLPPLGEWRALAELSKN
jgi:GTP-binding protein EngB required for normal cell division